MRVRMLRLAAGPEGVYHRGAEIVVDDAEGMDLVRLGYAVPVKEAREVAAVAPPEVRKAPRARKTRKQVGGVE